MDTYVNAEAVHGRTHDNTYQPKDEGPEPKK